MSRDLSADPIDEARLIAGMARELDAMTTTGVQPTDGFADRVMLAIADEPLPQPVRAFGVALVGGHLRAAAAAAGDAWRTISSAPAPVAVRAQALALVLILLVGSLTLAGGAAVGAFDLLGNGPSNPAPSGPPPNLVSPSPSPSPSPITEESPSASPEDSASDEPTDTPEASETADAQETSRPAVRPRTATPTATDDHRGGGGTGRGGDGETPSPTESDGHSSGDG